MSRCLHGLLATCLINNLFTNEHCRLLLNLRFRSLSDIKQNFEVQNGDISNCPLCDVYPYIQEHVIEHLVLRSKATDLNTTHIKYYFIFRDTNHQKKVVKLITDISSVRDKIIMKEGTCYYDSWHISPKLLWNWLDLESQR